MNIEKIKILSETLIMVADLSYGIFNSEATKLSVACKMLDANEQITQLLCNRQIEDYQGKIKLTFLDAQETLKSLQSILSSANEDNHYCALKVVNRVIDMIDTYGR